MKNPADSYCKKNHNDLEKAEQELRETLEQLRSNLGEVYSDVVSKITDISFSVMRLTQMIDNESTLRLKIEGEESKARLQLEQNESQSRLNILQRKTSEKARLTLLMTAIAGLAVGSGAVTLVNMLAGQ